jgi:hypothetical protein
MKEQKNKKEVKVNAKGGDNNDRLFFIIEQQIVNKKLSVINRTLLCLKNIKSR